MPLAIALQHAQLLKITRFLHTSMCTLRTLLWQLLAAIGGLWLDARCAKHMHCMGNISSTTLPAYLDVRRKLHLREANTFPVGLGGGKPQQRQQQSRSNLVSVQGSWAQCVIAHARATYYLPDDRSLLLFAPV